MDLPIRQDDAQFRVSETDDGGPGGAGRHSPVRLGEHTAAAATRIGAAPPPPPTTIRLIMETPFGTVQSQLLVIVTSRDPSAKVFGVGHATAAAGAIRPMTMLETDVARAARPMTAVRRTEATAKLTPADGGASATWGPKWPGPAQDTGNIRVAISDSPTGAPRAA